LAWIHVGATARWHSRCIDSGQFNAQQDHSVHPIATARGTTCRVIGATPQSILTRSSEMTRPRTLQSPDLHSILEIYGYKLTKHKLLVAQEFDWTKHMSKSVEEKEQ
jgi:hypothetical protein